MPLKPLSKGLQNAFGLGQLSFAAILLCKPNWLVELDFAISFLCRRSVAAARFSVQKTLSITIGHAAQIAVARSSATVSNIVIVLFTSG